MIVRGPFTLIWAGNTLQDIEAVEIDYEVNSDEYEANSGHVYEIDKSIKASIRLTFLASDITSLAAVLPQYFKAENEQLGDGNFVFDPRGAIDIIPDDCDTEAIYGDLEIVNCGQPEERFKLMNARTVVDGFDIGKVRKIVVKFIGEPAAGQSLIQLLGDLGDENFFQLGNDELFLLGNGENLIL